MMHPIYRIELIRRIGQAEVDRLEGPATQDKLSRDDLIALRVKFAKMARDLERRKKEE